MANVLKEVANINASDKGKDKEIVFDEIKKKFEAISGDGEQINILVKAFEENLESEKYTFNHSKIKDDIVQKDEDFSCIAKDVDTIKVYKLCKNLEKKGTFETIDENVPSELIQERKINYENQWVVFFWWECVNYDGKSNEMVLTTPFSAEWYHQSLKDSYAAIDNLETYNQFIKEWRQKCFDDFVKNNPNLDKESTDIESISMSENGVVTMDIKNDAYDASMETLTIDTQNIPAMPDVSGRDGKTDVEKVLYLIQQQRDGLKAIKESRVSENAALNTIIAKNVFTAEDMQVINEWTVKNKDIQPNKLKTLQEKMDAMINAASVEVNKKIWANVEGNVNYYTEDQIKLFQLRANVCFGENVSLDGKRGSLFYSTLNTENEKKTNLYIYRQELITRSEITKARKDLKYSQVMDELLAVPNLEDLLSTLWDTDKQNKVFQEFLEFFRDIREAGIYFEDKIGKQNLKGVLMTLINKERYSDMSVEEYFKNIEESMKTTEAEGKPKTYLINADDVELKSVDDLTKTTPLKKWKKVISVIENGTEASTKTGKELGLTKIVEQELVYKKVTVDNVVWWIPETSLTKKESALESTLALKSEILKEGYATMWEYYVAEYKSKMDAIISVHAENIEINTRLWTAKEVLRLTDELKILKEELATLDKNVNDMTEIRAKSTTRTDAQEAKYQKLCLVQYEDWSSDLATDVKKEEIILKMMEIYKTKNDYPQYPLEIYMQMKAYFKEGYVKVFLEEHADAGLTYADYLAQTKEYDTKKNPELKKRDPVNDIMLQYDAKETISLSSPSRDEFERVFGSSTKPWTETYKARNAGWIWSTSWTFENKDNFVPHNVYKLTIPGWSTMIVKDGTNDGLTPFWFDRDLLGYLAGNVESINFAELTQWSKIIVGEDLNGKTITASNFYVAEKNSSWDILMGKMSSNGRTYSTTPSKTITQQDQISASNALNMANMDTYDYEMQQVFRTFQWVSEEMGPIMDGRDKFKSDEWIGDAEVKKFYKNFSSFQKYSLPLLEGEVSGWKKTLVELRAMRWSTSGIKNASEENIEKMIKTFESMIDFYEVSNGTSKARELFKEFPKVWANDNNWDAFKTRMRNNWIAMLCSIAAAVAAIVLIIPTWGTSLWYWALLISAMVGTWAGMVGYRVGTMINEGIQNTYNPIYVNGQKIEYVNETDVEKYIAGTMTAKEFWTGIGTEFIMWTITTFWFMVAGTIIGQALTKAWLSPNRIKPTSRLWKFKDVASNLAGTSEEVIATNAANSFGKRFLTEFAEETFEETVENTSQAVHPALGWIMTMINCLNGHPAWFAQKHNLSGGLTTIDGSSIRTQLCYNSQNVDEIIKFYVDTKGYTANTNIKTGKVELTKPMDNANIVKTKSGEVKLDTHVLELIPSQASKFLNNSAAFFAEYGAKIEHESENNKISIDKDSFPALKVAIETQNIGTVITDTEGNVKIVTEDQTINVVINESEEFVSQKSDDQKSIEEDVSLIGKDISTGPSDAASPTTQNIIEFTEEQVKANANLDKESKNAKAEEILGTTLQEWQGDALWNAHEVGKDRAWAGVYSYTRSEIRTKIEILEKAWFDVDQRRKLLESGLCGKVSEMDTKLVEDVETAHAAKNNLLDMDKFIEDIRENELLEEKNKENAQEEEIEEVYFNETEFQQELNDLETEEKILEEEMGKMDGTESDAELESLGKKINRVTTRIKKIIGHVKYMVTHTSDHHVLGVWESKFMNTVDAVLAHTHKVLQYGEAIFNGLHKSTIAAFCAMGYTAIDHYFLTVREAFYKSFVWTDTEKISVENDKATTTANTSTSGKVVSENDAKNVNAEFASENDVIVPERNTAAHDEAREASGEKKGTDYDVENRKNNTTDDMKDVNTTNNDEYYDSRDTIVISVEESEAMMKEMLEEKARKEASNEEMDMTEVDRKVTKIDEVLKKATRSIKKLVLDMKHKVTSTAAEIKALKSNLEKVEYVMYKISKTLNELAPWLKAMNKGKYADLCKIWYYMIWTYFHYVSPILHSFNKNSAVYEYMVETASENFGNVKDASEISDEEYEKTVAYVEQKVAEYETKNTDGSTLENNPLDAGNQVNEIRESETAAITSNAVTK